MAAYNLDSIKDPRQHNSIPVFLRDLRICHAGHEKRMEGFVYEARNRYDLPRPVRFHHHPRLPFALRLSFCLRVSPLGRWTTGMGKKRRKKRVNGGRVSSITGGGLLENQRNERICFSERRYSDRLKMWVKGDVNRGEESEGKRYGEERISEEEKKEEKKEDKISKSRFQEMSEPSSCWYIHAVLKCGRGC